MSSGVRLAVQRMEIPTYVSGPDSPYPALMLGWEYGFYPYSYQLDVRTEKRPVEHRVIVLENDYVEAVILPDMGGRLYSLFDKVARQHTFMVPPSVKYQNISMRGAWIAGGIELNFGHRGHNVSTVNPVSWTTRTEPDGSVSVFVGTVVRPLEMRWFVRYNLQPDRSAIDMNITTVSSQVLPGQMYWWTNSAVDVGEQSKFYYFGHKANGHALHSWPVTDGLDYSWYRNRLFGSDMFLSDPQRDYMAFYDFGRHHGLAQTANRFLAPGQKYFTWGCDSRGKYWDLLLSDSEQTYCEIQRGRLETQGLTEPIPPMSVDGWTETWMPINKTEGFGGLENDLVVSVAADGQRAVMVRLLSMVPRHDLHVEALSSEESLDIWEIEQINPGVPASHRLELDKGQACKRVKVTGPDGAVLMDWTEFEYKDEDWTKDYKWYDANKASDEELFLEAERQRFDWWPYRVGKAISLHEKILAKDPGHTGSLRAMAEIDIWRGQFAKAQERLNLALQRKPLDPSLQQLLGWTLIYLDRPAEAVGAFMTAGRYEPDRRNGLIGVVSAYVKAGQFAEADRVAGELIALYASDRWAMLMKVMTLRKTDRREAAAKLVADLLTLDPIWSRATAEALLLDVPANLADGQRKLADDCITAAGPYLELGLWADAARVLEQDECGEALSPAVRLGHLLYARHKLGDKAEVKAALKQLRQAPVELAHPWSTASLIVLSELAAEYPEESMVQLMLGNILSSRNRADEAKAAWKKALDLGLEHTVVCRNLAVAEADDKDAALAYYRKAWKLGKGNQNLFAEYDRFLARHGLHKDREKLYQQLPADVKELSMVALRRAPQLLDMARYDEALEHLTTGTFQAGEGGERGPRVLWLEALLGKAVELLNKQQWQQAEEVIQKGFTYPRNLNAGRSAMHSSESMLHYLMGLVADATDRPAAAREHWLAAVGETHVDCEPAQAYAMLAWLALGNWPKALELAHRFERVGRGEVQPSDWSAYFNGPSAPRIGVGFAELARGRLEPCRQAWKKALAEVEKDARWIRPHLLMSDDLLRRMSRDVAQLVEQVHKDAREQAAKVAGPKEGSNGCRAGDCNPGSNGDRKSTPAAKRAAGPKKVRK